MFTDKELNAVIFAVESDLETVLGDPESFKGDEVALQSALDKLYAVKQEPVSSLKLFMVGQSVGLLVVLIAILVYTILK